MLEDVLKKWGGVEVAPIKVYSDMFQLGENEIQKNGEPAGEYKSNPLGYWKNNGESTGHYRILFDDDFEETLKELQQADFSIVNGITYFGKKNVQAHASKMYAMIFDIDGVTDSGLDNFLNSAFSKEYNIYPLPNYIVLSGHGVHLYYLFDYAIPLYPNIKFQLKEMKYALTQKIWNRYTSEQWQQVQYQGINQGFRVIGGKTKIEGVVSRAFQLNTHPYTLEQLNDYVPKDKQVDETKLWKERKLTLEQAKKLYPQWYERRVKQGEKKGTWICKEDLYKWWLKQIKQGASVGHRYFCIMCLAIYGVKSGVSQEQVKKDALELKPFLNLISGNTEPFTDEDIKSALECFDERYITFPIEDISKLTAIPIKKNKRNGRKQSVHVKYMNIQRAFKVDMGECTNGGRPSAEKIVIGFIRQNPTARKCDVIKRTGLDKKTVYKYYEAAKEKISNSSSVDEQVIQRSGRMNRI